MLHMIWLRAEFDFGTFFVFSSIYQMADYTSCVSDAKSLRNISGVSIWDDPTITSQFLTTAVTSYAQRISE